MACWSRRSSTFANLLRKTGRACVCRHRVCRWSLVEPVEVDKCRIKDSGNKLKAGFSSDAAAASSGRTVEPVGLMGAQPGKLRSAAMGWFPRDKSLDGSSLFFIVWPFLFRLPQLPGIIGEDQYYGLC